MNVCKIDGCQRPGRARGWCRMHWTRWRRHGSPHVVKVGPRGTCTVDGCDRDHHARGLCAAHLQRLERNGDVAADTPVVVGGVPLKRSREPAQPESCVGCGGPPMPGAFRCVACFHRWMDDRHGRLRGTSAPRPDPARGAVRQVRAPQVLRSA